MDVDPTAASTSADASHPNGQPAEQPVASTSTAASGSSKPAGKAKPPAAVVLVGPELDRALDRGDDVEVSWPFRGPDAWSDWRGIEALWCVLFHRLLVMADADWLCASPCCSTGSTRSPRLARSTGRQTTRRYS
jgi:hypothetical protein